jgi:hypothetical protein
MELEDPLYNFEALEVKDISSARYALKTANDQHFAVKHMRENMERELQRSRREIVKQAKILLEPFIPDTWTEQQVIIFWNGGNIPADLLELATPEVKAGIAHMEAQYEKEVERAEAELADQCEPLNEIEAALLELVKKWFKEEVAKRPNWLGNHNTAVIGGCTLTYTGGDVQFEFEELDYGD